MDWDTPPQTKALGAAALLAAAAALWPPRQEAIPLLNEAFGPLPAESAPKDSVSSLSPVERRLPRELPEETPSLSATEDWRDAFFAAADFLPKDILPASRVPWLSPAESAIPGSVLPPEKQAPASKRQKKSPDAVKPASRKKMVAAQDVESAPAALLDARPGKAFFTLFSRPRRAAPRPKGLIIRGFKGLRRGGNDSPPPTARKVSPSRQGGAVSVAAASKSSKTAGKNSRRRAAPFRPILLSSLLGKNTIRPPQGDIPVPDLSDLARRIPANGPEGRPWKPAAGQARDVESWQPPQPPMTGCRRGKGHWHQTSGSQIYHEGKDWAATTEGRFGWLARRGGRWWAWSAPGEPTWLSHGGRWWWKSEGVWFLLHQAQAWAYRLFLNGRAEGLLHPGTGTSMVYSQDGRRVAVVTPGAGAVLFDALTGQEIRRWSEEELKPRRRPAAPSALTFPP